MIACYCRVSSRRQRNDSQKAEITRWLRAHGISPSKVTWFEDKETGKTVRRDAFDQMEKAIFDGTIQTVVVWKLDRISRRLKDGINRLADWCERGVRVVSITQQIDLSGPVGRMVASVMFGLAEIELEYRRERQQAGIAVARNRGVYRGRRRRTIRSGPSRQKIWGTRGWLFSSKTWCATNPTIQRRPSGSFAIGPCSY